MRRCPACHELYEGTEKFCDDDGTPLVEVATPPAPHASPSRDAWMFVTFGLMGGIVISLFLSAFLFASWRDGAPAEREGAARLRGAGPQRAPARPSQVASALTPEASPTPAESPTPEEETAEQDESAAPAPTAAAPRPRPASLNEGPVSTGLGRAGGAEGQTLIRLKDGTQVEVDAAWEDAQGVWYRRGALVAFVERSRVETITGRAQAEASPTPDAP